MGYKSNDPCLEKVGSDEPIFVLRAQDKFAPILVRLWADLVRLQSGDSSPGNKKAMGALFLADEMKVWQARTGKAKFPD
jgi:hypothetical protein